MPFIVPGIAAGLTPIIGAAAAEWVAPLIPGIAFSAIGLLLAEKPPDPPQSRIPIQQDTPPRNYAYGEDRLSGMIMLVENVSDELCYVVALASHASESIDRFYLDDREVLVTAHVVGSLGDGQYGDGRVKFYWRLGAVPETSYTLDSGTVAYLEIDPDNTKNMWSSDHRGDGITSLLLLCNAPDQEHFGIRFPNGRPTPSVVGKWAKVYDPRDPLQDPDDETTFAYSDNIALQIMHFLCFNEFTANYDFNKSILPVIENWKTQADICDEDVLLNTGATESRYVGGGFGTTANDAKSILQRMLQGCDGQLIFRGDGTVVLFVGAFQWNGATITDDQIIGFHMQDGAPDEEAINFMNGRFISKEHEYGAIQCDPYTDSAFTVTRSYLRTATLDVPWVKSFTHCRRLMKREVFRINRRKRGYFDLKLSALNCAYERWIKIVSTRFPSLNGTYIENRKPTISLMNASMRIEWAHAGNGTDVDLWDETVDEGTRPQVVPRYNTPGTEPPVGVAVVAQEFLISDSVTAVRLEVSFDTPISDRHRFRIRWQVKDTDSGTPGDQEGPWHDTYHPEAPILSGGRGYLYTDAVQSGTELNVQVMTQNSAGAVSEPSPTQVVDTASPAPGPVTNLTSSLVSNVPVIRWKNPNGENMHHARVERVATGDPPKPSTDVSGELGGSPLGVMTFADDSATSGTWDYYVYAENGADLQSVLTGPTTQTVV